FTIDSAFVDVAENRLLLGTDVCLFRPAPNPFTRTTVVRLTLPRAMPITADLYNAAGQKVRSLASGVRCAGAHSLVWDGTDAGGRSVQAGIYYLRMTAESGTVTQAIVRSR
ncbi:MAG: T9SS type A sorting domain-containing protein, partial [candidate division WOR-3 bacterium]|nr:T9SS type A sorting domain-containing protein [candidate division WOR-3 bacterium]